MAKLEIKVDVTGESQIKDLDKSLDKLEHSSQKVNKQNKITSSSLGAIAASTAIVVGSLYTLQKAMSAVISSGFEYAKQMEQSKAGLSALSLAIQDKNLPLTERMTNANKEATVVMRELQMINAKTPHTLNETNRIYKSMYVSMKDVGASSQEIITLTQKLSVAAGAAGIESRSLIAGIDGLASGTVAANSDLGKFLGSLGLTNKVLKESSDVVKLLNDKLEDFRAIDTITTAASNLENAWGKLSEQMTIDLFAGTKAGMNEISKLMTDISKEDTKDLQESFNGLAIGMATALLGITKGVVFLIDGFESLGARIAGVAFRLEHGIFLTDAQSVALEKMYQTTKDNIKGREDYIKVLEKAVDTGIQAIKTSQNQKKATIDESEALDILTKKTKESNDVIGQATDAELDKIYVDELAALGLDALGDELIKTNDLLEYSKDAYGEASDAAEGYANSVNSLTQTLSASEQNESTTGVYKTTTTAPGEYVNTLNPYTYTSLTTDAFGNSIRQFADGGYTGNIPTSDVAGVVHGQEYVVDAQTTKDLGLNGSFGIFQEISDKLDHLFEINLTTKRSLTTQKSTKTLLAGT